MSVTPAEAVRRLRERLAARPLEDLAAEASARRQLADLADKLRDAGATRVVLFGSLVGGWFRADSDIDLGVAGLSEPELARLERELTIEAGRLVELTNLDFAPPALRSRIEATGVELR